jgi:TRAP-type mannitol/chloroaromatic compound transport system permease small subunit
MPGKMVQCLKNVGTANPLVLIDEIDKVVSVHRVNLLLDLVSLFLFLFPNISFVVYQLW